MMDARTLRTRLTGAVSETMEVSGRLDAIVGEKAAVISDGSKHGRIDHSQPPWNAPVAHLLLDLHAWSRDTEATFRRLRSMPDTGRGGSDRNTSWALDAVSKLAEDVPDVWVADAVSWLERWAHRGMVVLGERDQLRHLPRQPNQPAPICPYCRFSTLRFLPSRGEVRCITPDCVDVDGHRSVARMEYSAIAMDWVLVWKDGTVGLPDPREVAPTHE